MSSSRRLVVAWGVAGLFALTGCGGDDPPQPDPDLGGAAASTPSLKPLEPTATPVEGDFDECGLVEPADLAAAMGTDALYVTAREVLPDADGGRLAGCSYFTEDVPGIVGMTINTVAGTDRERFFAPFRQRRSEPQRNFGDYAEVVAYEAGSVHFRELRAIQGTTGVHVRYTYNDAPAGMPRLETEQLAQVLGGTVLSALKKLPDDIAIASGAPEGPCAGVDLAQASRVLGGELTAARTVLGGGGAVNCQFAGDGASLGVVVITDPARVESMRAPAALVTVPDLGEGAMVRIQSNDEVQGPLEATVNLADRLVLLVADYGAAAGRVSAPRPEDTDLVRTVTRAVGGWQR